MKYILALGTNLGDRISNIQTCIDLLSVDLKIIKTSPIYETKAKLPPKASSDWNLPYLNCALSVETHDGFQPKDLLNITQEIESKMGRERRTHSLRWAPRIIDIDIILAQGITYKDGELIIPHPQFLQRDFVLTPIKDIEPDFYIPQIGKRIKDIDLSRLEKNIIGRV